MAIPSSGAISLSTIQTEFGGANPISLNEYYAGGAYVAAGTTGTYGAVPSSGQISVQNFYGTSAVVVGSRGVFFGGAYPSVNVIQYITITTTGNATDFGDLTFASTAMAACGSATRGIKAGGYNPGFSTVNVIEYITFDTTGNATDFGDLTTARPWVAGCNSSTRGLFGGGSDPSNVIDYITIASVGNATDFGDLTVARGYLASCSSSTRGIWAGGYGASSSSVIDYVTIATTGNATDFGDLLTANDGSFAGCSSSTRGVFAGGTNPTNRTNVIQYITIASAGNATDFGDLTEKPNNNAGCSNATRAVFGGGEKVDPEPAGKTNVITYVTIASTGNATDFGDLLSALDGISATSSGNGGVQ